MSSLSTWARRGLHLAAGTLFVLLVSLVLAQVVARKFFEPLVWSEELARYVFIWVALLGWVIAGQRRSHVSVNLLVDRCGPAGRRALAMLSDAATVLLMAVLLRQGLQLVANNRDVDTVTLGFSYALVYAVLPLAAACLLLDTVLHARQRWAQAAQGAALADAQELAL